MYWRQQQRSALRVYDWPCCKQAFRASRVFGAVTHFDQYRNMKQVTICLLRKQPCKTIGDISEERMPLQYGHFNILYYRMLRLFFMVFQIIVQYFSPNLQLNLSYLNLSSFGQYLPWLYNLHKVLFLTIYKLQNSRLLGKSTGQSGRNGQLPRGYKYFRPTATEKFRDNQSLT